MRAIDHQANRDARLQASADLRNDLRDEQRRERMSMKIAAMALDRLGFTVIQVLAPEEVQVYHDSLLNDMREFPEYVEGHDLGKQVLGGFSALGNPSSFHCPTVRTLRKLVHPKVKKNMHAFKHMLPDAPTHFEQIVDRVLYRTKGDSASKESWHRDFSSGTHQGDLVFGGWLNLDMKGVHHFSYIAGTHRAGKVLGDDGFVKLSTEQQKLYNRKREKPLHIRPGQLLIFNERIVHEIASKPLEADYMLRLFMGWRLTNSTEPLVKNLQEVLDTQAVMPLKSGQMPRIYPKLYWTNHVIPKKEGAKSLQDLKGQFKSSVYMLCKMQSGRHEGKTFQVPHLPNGKGAHIDSLLCLSERDPGIKPYAAYDREEVELLFPTKL